MTGCSVGVVSEYRGGARESSCLSIGDTRIPFMLEGSEAVDEPANGTPASKSFRLSSAGVSSVDSSMYLCGAVRHTDLLLQLSDLLCRVDRL